LLTGSAGGSSEGEVGEGHSDLKEEGTLMLSESGLDMAGGVGAEREGKGEEETGAREGREEYGAEKGREALSNEEGFSFGAKQGIELCRENENRAHVLDQEETQGASLIPGALRAGKLTPLLPPGP